MTNWQARAEELQRHCDDLTDRFDELNSALTAHGAPVVPYLTTSETKVGQLLRHHAPNLVMKNSIYSMLYSLRHGDELVENKIINVFICKLRKKLSRHQLAIETIWGRGYRMTADGADTWDNLSLLNTDAADAGSSADKDLASAGSSAPAQDIS